MTMLLHDLSIELSPYAILSFTLNSDPAVGEDEKVATCDGNADFLSIARWEGDRRLCIPLDVRDD